ncbi:hypothetical protein K1T35_42510 [Pseudonocardia sp. DSM 110487]|uniref:hypothetical protein n=1 Tax=Pseudonocardia sp. DSM 110487 TaxID=2865833 RepID=UPI001C69E2E4|nr:hypothetical protein [Pseudonocardia sp. DSM 110487]QYN34952.1 hypothetical protein K1T35_42510 [Pseudonocardia sp. DSM 110487]
MTNPGSVVQVLVAAVADDPLARWLLPGRCPVPSAAGRRTRRARTRARRRPAPRLVRADADGLPAYLEATSLRSRSLYERHGFRDAGDPIQLPDGPSLWPMWRPTPRQGAKTCS